MSKIIRSDAFNEDCLLGMCRFQDKHFGLAICDINYGIGASTMAYTRQVGHNIKQKNGNKLNGSKNKVIHTQKDWDNEPPPSQEYFDELCRVSKHQIIFGVEYVNWVGLGKGRIKWNKCVPDGMSFKGYEMAYCSLIDYEMEIPLLWSGMNQAKSLSEPTVMQGNKKLNEKRIHPCHKPVLLYRKLLQEFAKNGDEILDTHLGGGSIRIACHELGFNFTGFEIDEEYFLKEEIRFNQYLYPLQQKLSL